MRRAISNKEMPFVCNAHAFLTQGHVYMWMTVPLSKIEGFVASHLVGTFPEFSCVASVVTGPVLPQEKKLQGAAELPCGRN